MFNTCSTAPLVALLWLAWCAACAPAAAEAPPPDGGRDESRASASAAYVTETIDGQVTWLEDALAQRFGVTTEPAAAKSAVVVETPEGQLWPVVPDTRGRAFTVDERLRGRPLQLLVRRYKGAPMVQVIRVFSRRGEELVEIDYWCDICAIPMYILKPCECCQGETRLRETPLEHPDAGD